MNKLSKEKKARLLAVAAGTGIVSAILWFTLIGEQNAQLQKYEDAAYSARDKLDKARFRIKRTATIQEELKELEIKINAAESSMIPVEQLNGKKWVFDLLTRFIKNRHNVTPTGLSNDPVVGKQFLMLPKFPYSAAAYDVEFRAFYHDFGKFLADFENSFPYISVQQLQMWPLATPSSASGPVSDLPEDLMNGVEREQLKISMKIVVLFKPAGSS